MRRIPHFDPNLPNLTFKTDTSVTLLESQVNMFSLNLVFQRTAIKDIQDLRYIPVSLTTAPLRFNLKCSWSDGYSVSGICKINISPVKDRDGRSLPTFKISGSMYWRWNHEVQTSYYSFEGTMVEFWQLGLSLVVQNMANTLSEQLFKDNL